jgi:hypothetical protein
MDDNFHISNESNTFSVSIDWDRSKGLEDFVYQVTNAFELPEDYSFVLTDVDGDQIVLSPYLRAGFYRLRPVNNAGALRSIVQNYRSQTDASSSSGGRQLMRGSNDFTDDGNDAGFETNLIRVACADALIANERTWLAWTRTSLNIMTVSSFGRKVANNSNFILFVIGRAALHLYFWIHGTKNPR